MSEFTWFQMLGNWYCWQGVKPVAIVKLTQGYNWEYGQSYKTWNYWFTNYDSEGWFSADHCSFDEMKQSIQQAFLKFGNNLPKERMIGRFQRKVWEGEPWEDTVYDVYYVDRLTGKVVISYDGADPANTNPDYGAESDYWKLRNKGYDLKQRIPEVLGR